MINDQDGTLGQGAGKIWEAHHVVRQAAKGKLAFTQSRELISDSIRALLCEPRLMQRIKARCQHFLDRSEAVAGCGSAAASPRRRVGIARKLRGSLKDLSHASSTPVLGAPNRGHLVDFPLHQFLEIVNRRLQPAAVFEYGNKELVRPRVAPSRLRDRDHLQVEVRPRYGVPTTVGCYLDHRGGDENGAFWERGGGDECAFGQASLKPQANLCPQWSSIRPLHGKEPTTLARVAVLFGCGEKIASDLRREVHRDKSGTIRHDEGTASALTRRNVIDENESHLSLGRRWGEANRRKARYEGGGGHGTRHERQQG
mmetsp:Transcript_28136/g.85976  ORF Transcript_28136/g.85976 Transcript_28136/m.85976 type:complete len:313 (+) Transcript_28136:1669-2607(+)|eukprot:scaffold5528_cov27-Tisochrysis_lutea.AAC.2